MKKLSSTSRKTTILVCFFLAFQLDATAQYCDSITPEFTVDLTAAPYMTWLSPDTDRDGFCCGATSPDKCLEFIITLHPNSAAVVFNIASGAVPPGALFYQIDCGPPIAVGSPICLIGTGPFHLTFCKPGNNTNTFSIETIPNPIFGPNLTLGDGCNGELAVQFYDETTVTWNSVNPGAIGDFNGLLSCSVGCDTTTVTNNASLPAQVDYLVCGMGQNGCTTDPICDTMIVQFAPPLQVSIVAPDTVLCPNETLVAASLSISGGTPPYTINWSNGTTTSNANLAVGLNTVTVTDVTNCIVATDQVTVVQLMPISVDAGPSADVCVNYIGAITLNGSSVNAEGVIWSGGLGTFIPNNMAAVVDYIPDSTELTPGSLDLTISSTNTMGCPNASDIVGITFNSVAQTVDLQVTNISCFGAADGTVAVTVTGPQAPFTYSFDGGPYTSTTTYGGLTPGTHTVTVLSNLGCDSLISFLITEPEPLVADTIALTNVSCFGGTNGLAEIQATGGTTPYSYAWNTTPVQTAALANNLPAGAYTVQVTDANNCLFALNLAITEPQELIVSFNTVPPSCNGLSNGAISGIVSGGTISYSYNWSTGSTATSIYSVGAGSYSLTITDANGCTQSANELVIEPPLLEISLNPDTIICPGTSQLLSAVVTGGTGTYTYNWSPDPGATATLSVAPVINTTYTCIVQDNNGCTASATSTISVFTLNQSDLTASISQDSICLHDSAMVSAAYLGLDPTVVLVWDFCPNCAASAVVFPTTNSSYTVTATNQCGQQISETVSIVVVPPPAVDLLPTLASVCPDEYFSVTNQAANNPNWSYSWDFGDGETSTDMAGIHSYDSPGIYTVSLSVVNSFGCQSDSIATTTITVNPNAMALFTPSSYVETTLDPDFTFLNQSENANTYTWNFGDGETSDVTHPNHIYEGYGVFTVTLNANNEFNCPGQYQVDIEIKPSFNVYIPNAFTPDGDAHNQVFYVQGYGIKEDGFELSIFDRWGEVIFYTNDLAQGWDGTYKGDTDQVQDGVYTWVIQFKDLTDMKHQMNGHVSLLK
ncbi:MAG: PKD domain-containing protein [Bacteroidota bacterium]